VLMEISKMEQRYDAVIGVMRDGFTVTEAAQKFGVSRQSLYRWMARYEEGGLEALAEGSHRPKFVPHQMAGELETRVLEMRRTHPLWGPLRIQHQLKREGFDPPPSHMAIYRALVRHGLIEPGVPRKKLPTYKRWERGRPTSLADGRRRRCSSRGRHRVQDLDGHRRPFEVHGLRGDHGARNRATGLFVLRRGLRASRGARGSAHG
jgi:transposase